MFPQKICMVFYQDPRISHLRPVWFSDISDGRQASDFSDIYHPKLVEALCHKSHTYSTYAKSDTYLEFLAVKKLDSHTST